jgi:urease beta subunit
MIPGEVVVASDAAPLEINPGRETKTLVQPNTGDRPVQVGSRYHVFKVNNTLEFDRQAARGFRLNIAAGTAVRFEPGDSREVRLVALAGLRQVFGFNAKVSGNLE